MPGFLGFCTTDILGWTIFLLPGSVLCSVTSTQSMPVADLRPLPHIVTVKCISRHCRMSWGKFARRLRTISLAQPRFLSMAPGFLEKERGSSQWFQGLGPEVPDHDVCHILLVKVGHAPAQTEGEGKITLPLKGREAKNLWLKPWSTTHTASLLVLSAVLFYSDPLLGPILLLCSVRLSRDITSRRVE